MLWLTYFLPLSYSTIRTNRSIPTLIDLNSQPPCVCFSASQAPIDRLHTACYTSIADLLLHLANPVLSSNQVREIREALHTRVRVS